MVGTPPKVPATGLYPNGLNGRALRAWALGCGIGILEINGRRDMEGYVMSKEEWGLALPFVLA